MTKKQRLLEELKRCQTEDDTESGHLNADDALLAYINDKEITKAFNNIHKWYA